MAGEGLPQDRLGLEVLTEEQCWALVADTPIGRVAFVDAGEPVVLPVTHGVHGRQVVFRSAGGTKLDAAKRNLPVAFEVDAWDPGRRQGWSVLVRGTAEAVYDDEEIAALEATGAEPWTDAAANGTWVRIIANEVSGRRLPG